MRHTHPPLPDPAEAEIQHAAYLLWIEEGRPEGRDLEHWLSAKELLRHHHGRTAGRTRRPPAKPAIPAATLLKN
jgi:hypothetical protein